MASVLDSIGVATDGLLLTRATHRMLLVGVRGLLQPRVSKGGIGLSDDGISEADQKRQKERETRNRIERDLKLQNQQELVAELRSAFDKIEGITEASQELEEIVEKFKKEDVVKSSITPVVDFVALAQQEKIAKKLLALSKKIEEQREEELLTILLLGAL